MEAENGDGASLLMIVLGSAAAGCVCALIIRVVSAGFVSTAWTALPRIFGSAKACIFNPRAKQQRQQELKISSNPAPPPSDQPSVKKVIAQQSKVKPVKGGDKAHSTPRHRLELNTIKGHGDAITGLSFTSNGRGLASACADRLVRIFKLEDASSKNQQVLRLNVPAGCVPTGVAFGEGASKIVVATQDINGAGLLMFGAADGKAAALAREQGKLPPPEIKWKKEQIHDKKSVITCVGARSEYGSGDGSVLVVTCSEGTDIKLWSADIGKCVAVVDTNQLKNTMATISPDGRFLTAAAFTADVKVWEIIYGKDGQVREVVKVMLLKGHKSAVTWACFTWDSKRIITASKDGTVRIWNIDVRYQMDEDPKCLKVFSVQSNGKGEPGHYDKIALSPDNKILAVTQGLALRWISIEDGQVLDTAPNAHDGEIACMIWAPQALTTDHGKVPVLATGGFDKKLKLWSGALQR